MEYIKAKVDKSHFLDGTRWATMEDINEPCCTALPRYRAALDVFSANSRKEVGAAIASVVFWRWQSGLGRQKLQSMQDLQVAWSERERLLTTHHILSAALEKRERQQERVERESERRSAHCKRIGRFVESRQCLLLKREVAVCFLRWACNAKMSPVTAPMPATTTPSTTTTAAAAHVECVMEISLRGADVDLLKQALLVWLLSAMQGQASEVCAEISELREERHWARLTSSADTLVKLQLRRSFVLHDVIRSWSDMSLRARSARCQPEGFYSSRIHLHPDGTLHELLQASVVGTRDRSSKRRVSVVNRAAVGVLRLRYGLILREVVRGWLDEVLRAKSEIAESQSRSILRRTSRLVAAILLAWTAENADAFFSSVLHFWREIALVGTIDAFQHSLVEAKRRHHNLVQETLIAWRYNDNAVISHLVMTAWQRYSHQSAALPCQNMLAVPAADLPDPASFYPKPSVRRKVDSAKAIVVPEIGKPSAVEGAAAVVELLSARPPVPPSAHGPPQAAYGQCCVWPRRLC